MTNEECLKSLKEMRERAEKLKSAAKEMLLAEGYVAVFGKTYSDVVRHSMKSVSSYDELIESAHGVLAMCMMLILDLDKVELEQKAVVE